MWTFGKRITIGFALSFVSLVVIGGIAYRSIGVLVHNGLLVNHTHLVVEHLATLMGELRDAETGQRGFVITGDESFLQPHTAAISAIPATIKNLRQLTVDHPKHQRHLDELEPVVGRKLAELQLVIDARRAGSFEAAAKIVQAGEGKKSMDQVRAIVGEMDSDAHALLKERGEEMEAAATTAGGTIIGGTAACLALVIIAGLLIVRALARQIGSAVHHVQSSSAQLEAAATQQVTGAKEQSTAMTEITTTISELLATSRQIADSAQRVARMAAESAQAARSGDDAVTRTQDSVVGIKRQVDLIVAHMVELGRKSQQIGGILEIINELSEQTNILAINATIEAAGAGELGRRFAVVADEIRKLADRVGGSTKDIRGLVDDIRAAVNTTVMATEGGSKAVDAGARQFGEVAASFKQIGGIVVTTTEAAREIELSTKQQASAVEQVNLAIANVSQAARESEASSTQTLQTSSQLTVLSKSLSRLIQPQATA